MVVLSALFTSLIATLPLAGTIEAAETPSLPLSDSVTHNWGAYSPFFSLAEYSVPGGCTINQVNLLHRHGARFPTAKNGAKLNTTVSQFSKATSFSNPNMTFLGNYTYTLGAENLVPFGAQEAFDSGTIFFGRYNFLLSSTASGTPFVRASSAQRVVDTATNFSSGFLTAAAPLGIHFTLPSPLVISESGNDTLVDGTCPDAGGSGNEQEKWVDVYTPDIADRLNDGVKGVKVSNDDVQNLMEMCAFETIVQDGSGVSQFCALFEEDEWVGFEYSSDVDKYYDTGYGQKLGPVQGVGWTNELLARLTNQPLNDSTQSNHSLPFPLNHTMYLDFSHDNELIAIYSVIGLFPQSKDLSETSMPKDPSTETWVASRLVPFAARMVVERLQCGGSSDQMVRILVNDQVQPMEFCDGVNEQGLCSLENFVASQGYARSGGDGDWQKCFK